MRYLTLAILCLALLNIQSAAQEKKRLSHDDYDHWKNLSGIEISADGDHLLYIIYPQRQDGDLFILNHNTGQQTIVPRGARAAFSQGSGFAVFHIQPPQDVVRQAKVAKTRRENMPKDSLGIYVMGSRQLIKYEDVISYRLPKEPSDWFAFALDFAKIIEEIEEEEETLQDTIPPHVPEPQEEEKKEKEPKTETIKQLVVKNPVAGKKHVFDYVEHYQISENGKSVIFLQEEKNDNDSLEIKKLYVFDTESESLNLLDSAEGDFKQLSVNKTGELYSWLFSADTTDVKVYDLFVHQSGRRARTYQVSSETENMPVDYAVSEHQSLSFSDDSRRVFFGIAPKPEEEKEDTLLAEEKYRLDIWHWQDPLLQSQQKMNLRREQRRSYDAVFHIRNERMIPLAGEDLPDISRDRYGNADVFMGSSSLPYQREISWEGFAARDIYVVNVNSGSRKKVLERAEANVHFSVKGDYILYYDPVETNWFAYSVRDDVHRNLTVQIDVPFYNEDNDIPRAARPWGLAGWGENDAFVLIYDRYDIWKLDPRGRNQPVNITGGNGRENQVRFRYQNLDPDEYHIPGDVIYLSAFNLGNKQDGYYRLNMRSFELEPLMTDDARFTQLQKAKDDDTFLWRKSTFTEFPDLWISDMEFNNARKLTTTNPQQEEYLWGSVKLVEWIDFRNETLQGLLYLPEDFDPEEKYPMIVYFYERSSDGLHSHFIPSPSRSTINRSYCTSNGYIVFVPDITYREGFPGQSAYNAIMSGTKAMVERYPFIDRHRMGLQGQSWGGYQIAYLITQTNMFRAAMAGAPVSNMVSAYGGIRWSSGMVRQFQYEKTQSRIGGTLWEKPFHYIENSPVFFADKIETPLLMMHNDEDGAVPWYQGIELFTAMRRLDKPVWMLVYNGEAHNLMEWPNRVDLSIRMYQFFDYYLKDKPAPQWLLHGRPYIDKNRTDAYELIE
jgi:dipeptidyl aminopeptidase/acylaminoacyl peptidase